VQGRNNLAYFLIGINLIAFLWPVQLVENDWHYHQFLLLITNYLNPLILFFYFCNFLINKNKINLSNIFYSSILYTILLIMSSLMGNEPIKNILIAIFFTLSSISMNNIYKHNYVEWPINMYMTKLLIFWSTLPVILLLFPDFHSLFVDDFESSFHGFAGGRIEYGLWTTVAILLSLTYRSSINKYLLYVLLFLMFFGLFLSQSRASFAALTACLIYVVNRKYINIILKLTFISIVSIVLTLILLSWEYFGRQNVLELLNSRRLEIYTYYFNQIRLENIFLGYGGMNSMTLENGVVTEAHNLLIQWLSNWGIFGLLALMLWLFLFWKSLDSIYPRMLFIALLFYSLIQPIQGTANFFGPVTLICFFIMMGMQCDYASKKILP
jgi:O-antigen ligase